MVTLKITNQIFNQRHEFESEDIGPQKVDLQKGEENSGRQVARMLTIYLFFEFLNFYMRHDMTFKAILCSNNGFF